MLIASVEVCIVVEKNGIRNRKKCERDQIRTKEAKGTGGTRGASPLEKQSVPSVRLAAMLKSGKYTSASTVGMSTAHNN